MKPLELNELNDADQVSEDSVLTLYISRNVSLHDNKTLAERWKHLLLEAEFLLLKKYSRSFVNEYLSKIKNVKITDYFSDSLDEALVIFYSPERFEGSPVFCRLATRTKDLAHVGNRFYLKPISKALNKSKGFFIVTMTSRAINVLIENKGHLVKIDSFRNEPGVDKKNKKDHHEFFVNASVELNKLFKAYRLPIVLAGVKTHLGKMRNLLNHSMLLEKAIQGNVEKMKAIDLQKKVYETL